MYLLQLGDHGNSRSSKNPKFAAKFAESPKRSSRTVQVLKTTRFGFFNALVISVKQKNSSALPLKVMLHGAIRNDDFKRNRALQGWNKVVTIRNNVATTLQRCVALKVVVANRLV